MGYTYVKCHLTTPENNSHWIHLEERVLTALDIYLQVWWTSVMILFDISFEGILSKTALYLAKHIQKTWNGSNTLQKMLFLLKFFVFFPAKISTNY